MGLEPQSEKRGVFPWNSESSRQMGVGEGGGIGLAAILYCVLISNAQKDAPPSKYYLSFCS